MNTIEFKKAFGAALLECGFKKERKEYYKKSDDLICVVGLQRASFEDSYYVNIGYVIRDIHPDVTAPHYYEVDAGARFTFLTDGKESDLFDPGAFPSENELKKVVRENVRELGDGPVSVPWLKALLARHPTMLYRVTVKAKEALGFDAE